jgi:hypothetical protein
MPIFWLKHTLVCRENVRWTFSSHWVFRQSAVAAVFMISDGFRRPETTDENSWFHRDWTLFKNNSRETCCNFPTLFEPECSRLTHPGLLHRLFFRRQLPGSPSESIVDYLIQILYTRAFTLLIHLNIAEYLSGPSESISFS